MKKLLLLLSFVSHLYGFGQTLLVSDTALFICTKDSSDYYVRLTYTLKNRSLCIEKNYDHQMHLISESTLIDGKLNGETTVWYPTGEKRSVETFSAGYPNGMYIEWYPNGKTKIIGSYSLKYRDSVIVLTQPTYDTMEIMVNGNKFASVSVDNFPGLKNGVWIFYDEKGVMIRRETWAYGTLVKTE